MIKYVIIILIISLSYNIYKILTNDKLSEEDEMDLLLPYNWHQDVPLKIINDYVYEERTEYNIVYLNKSSNIAKIYVRGTRNIHDIITDIKCYFSNDAVLKSDIYINSKKIMDKYKNYKIYLIAHSLGSTIANRLANMRGRYNIIKCKFFNPFFGFEKKDFHNKNIASVLNNFDIVTALTYVQNITEIINIKNIHRTLPTHSLEFVSLHLPEIFAVIYNDNILRRLDMLLLFVFIILLCIYQNFYSAPK